MIYTIRSKCDEVPSMPYDDGARTIFLYTKGTEGIPSEELENFLHYMEHTTGPKRGTGQYKTRISASRKRKSPG